MNHSNKSSRTKGGHLVDSVVQFSSDLQLQFPGKSPGSAESLRNLNDELENEINNLKLSNHPAKTSQQHKQLNTAGLNLWNWCVKQKRNDEQDSPPDCARLFTLARVLSFLMLASARTNRDNTGAPLFRLENLAIKTAKSCIENKEYDFALLALQKAAAYNGELQAMQGFLSEEDINACHQLEIQYSSLRIVLAWKQDRMDVAEHVYISRFDNVKETLDMQSAENLSDALFEIGKDLKDKNNPTLGVKWLERAYEVINTQDLDQVSRETVEMRTAVSQALISGYLDINTPETVEKAENHVTFVQSELGDNLVVLLLRIEILTNAPDETFDSNAYANVLRRMIRVIDLSESSFKLAIYHIRKLETRNHAAACLLLDEFLTTCVLKTQREEWIDQAVMLLMHFLMHDESPGVVEALNIVLDKILTNNEKPLSAQTAAGIQMLFSKQIDAHSSQERFDVAGQWCQLALHLALQLSGPSNTAKISRKSMLCAIRGNDLNSASAVLQTMSEATLKEPMTLFLAFKIALLNQDANEAATYLARISDMSASDPKYLYACCLEAQQAQDKFLTIEALRHLVSRHNPCSSGSIHMPAMLRLLIRLESTSLDDKDEGDKRFLEEDLCSIFEKAVEAMKIDRKQTNSEKLFTTDELDWFCKNAYNLGLANSTSWEARHVIRILEASLSIMSNYPSDISPEVALDISVRGMFCNFISATVLLALARSEDNLEVQLRDYLNMRRHIGQFSNSLNKITEEVDDASRKELHSKFSALLVFEFEGAICLKAWEDLKNIILRAKIGQDPLAYGAMADCTLRCQFMPQKVVYQTMRELINQIWALEKFDSAKLGKYMKCLLKVTLTMEHHISLNLIEEICSTVKQLASKNKYFPALELEWITVTAFNQGIDLHSHQGDEELSRSWIAHAMTLAQYIQDSGEIARLLQDKSMELKWRDVEDEVLFVPNQQ
ncbi:SPO22-domain-containing protein [Xylariaceae sp. FL0255]|nr:SPO22-domain-containing protein [Xylariaceae sp. FL0255]